MFLDDWVKDGRFYKELPLGFHTHFSFGQILRTHTYYPHENLELWRPVVDPKEPTKTFATHFKIEAAGQDAFRRNYPLASPKLGTNEEFLVVRAKTRPVVMVMPEVPPWGVDNRGFRGRVQRHLCLVAQVFGLADPKTGQAEFSSSFVDRVKTMEFPQLMFLPACPGFLEVDSLLRLDELQSVFTANLEPTKMALTDEVTGILRGQLEYLFVGAKATEYLEIRELLLQN